MDRDRIGPAAWAAVGLGMALAGLAGGCTPTEWRTPGGEVVTGKIDFQSEPVTGRTYHLFIPSSYTPKNRYPLVISGQGTFPFDQAAAQRDKWINVAERHNLIICSPDFDSATYALGIPADRPAPELVRDEEATLNIVDELKKRYSIDPDAIMITGWSAGAFPAHFIGLRNPDVFRCIVGRTGNFNERLVTDQTAKKARHMHVYVFFGEGDLPGFDAMNRDANFWYTVRGFRNFEIRRMPGGHNPNQAEAVRYFLNIVNHWPVVHVKATPKRGRAPLSVRFEAEIRDPDAPDGRVDSILWDFGDKNVAVGRSVTHTYKKPGLYNVFLTVVDLDRHQEYAQAWIQVD